MRFRRHRIQNCGQEGRKEGQSAFLQKDSSDWSAILGWWCFLKDFKTRKCLNALRAPTYSNVKGGTEVLLNRE